MPEHVYEAGIALPLLTARTAAISRVLMRIATTNVCGKPQDMTTRVDQRRFRFSLRTLMVLFCVICAIFAWVAHKMRRAHMQQEAVAWVWNQGGTVRYDFAVDEDLQPVWHITADGRLAPGENSPTMDFLRERIGVDILATPVSVSLARSPSSTPPTIDNLLPIAPLRRLQRLDIRGASIRDLSGVTSLTNLKYLNATDTAIHELPPLTGLRKLEELKLSHTNVSDLTPLAGMVQLKRLNLADTLVHDLSPLSTSTNLEELRLTGAPVEYLSGLENMANLRTLCLAFTTVRDLRPLTGLRKLENLSLFHTNVSDLTSLADIAELESLDLSDTFVHHLSPLVNFTQLRHLSLDRTPVRDVKPLARLSQLTDLSLCGTPVTNVMPLERLTNLRTLYLVNTDVCNDQVAKLKAVLPFCKIFSGQEANGLRRRW